MAFSMHSHSGQFCPGHAKDTLEEVVQTAISRGMQTFALTEHMPRNSNSDLYPEEIAAGHDISTHLPQHSSYIAEALRLRTKYRSQIHILIGFEGEWIRPSYGALITQLAADPAIDFFIGSIHHVHEIPIDYDAAMYAQAVARSGGTEEKLYADYFEQQFEMLGALRPRVVGHFDLIRLLSSEPERDLRDWEKVWGLVRRNLERVVRDGGMLEVNSSALRKGLREPYPGRRICELYLEMGGKFTLSDDSHGIAQVGTNFGRAIEYLESLGVKEVYTFERSEATESGGEKGLSLRGVPLALVKETFIPA